MPFIPSLAFQLLNYTSKKPQIKSISREQEEPGSNPSKIEKKTMAILSSITDDGKSYSRNANPKS
jgi:hypothetical protein